MLKNKVMKIVSLIITLILLVSITVPVFAAGGVINSYQPTGANSATSASVESISNQIIGIVQVVGVAIAVIMLIVLAIKYLTSSASDKAEIKKSAFIYVVGAICLFGAVGVMQIIKSFASQI